MFIFIRDYSSITKCIETSNKGWYLLVNIIKFTHFTILSLGTFIAIKK